MNPRPITPMVYFALYQKGFRRMMTYRAATLAGVATNFFFGLLRAYVLIAVFAASGRALIGGYSLRDAVTYTALTQALIGPIQLWSWWEVMHTIRSGDLIVDLAKPVDYYALWLARDLGRATFHLFFRGLPIFLFFPLFFALTWPDSVAHVVAIATSLALGVCLSFAWRFLVNLSAFWFLDAQGVGALAYLSMTFLSGFMVPVAFFPEWLQTAVNCTPLPSMINTPIEVYLGLVRGPALAQALATQLAWFAALTLMSRSLFRLGVQRVVIQGG